MYFIVEKKSYVSKTTGESKFAFNLFVCVNNIKLPLSLKGDTTALLIGHQLLESDVNLIKLEDNKSIKFEYVLEDWCINEE